MLSGPVCACVNVLLNMQMSCESSVISTSSSARLVSSSPPDTFPGVSHCQLPSPSTGNWSPAVLAVSEEYCVEDVELPPELETTAPLVRNTGQQSPFHLPSSNSQSHTSTAKDATTEEIEPHSTVGNCQRICTHVVAVILLVFGGILIPVSWVALRQDSKSSTRTECKSIATRLQWAIIGQGLLLSLTGLLLLGWNRTMHHHRPFGLHQRRCICVFSALATLSYAVLSVSLSFVVWQLMSASIYCHWATSHAMFIDSALTELLAVLLSAVSIGIMFMGCNKAFQ